MDHECSGRMGFEEVVDVRHDGYDGGGWSEKSAARESFDK